MSSWSCAAAFDVGASGQLGLDEHLSAIPNALLARRSSEIRRRGAPAGAVRGGGPSFSGSLLAAALTPSIIEVLCAGAALLERRCSDGRIPALAFEAVEDVWSSSTGAALRALRSC